MDKHTQTVRRQFPDGLFECVWLFYWVDTQLMCQSNLAIVICCYFDYQSSILVFLCLECEYRISVIRSWYLLVQSRQ